MRQTRDEIRQTLAERLCWEVTRRDDRRVARRLYRKQVTDGVYRLDVGALLDTFFHDLEDVGVMALLADIHGTAMQREMVPFVQYVLLYGRKTLFGIESMNALPALLCSNEALMQLVGFNAQQVRQGDRAPGPTCPDTLAKQILKPNVRGLEAVFNGAIRALVRAGVFGAKVTGIVDGTDLETTERSQGCGQVIRQVQREDTHGRAHEMEVTVYGWKVLLLIDAVTKIPLAVKVGQIDEHETHWTRALVTQARANLAGAAGLHKIVFDRGFGLHKIVFDRGFLDGTNLWWLDQQGLLFMVPAKTNMAVTVDERAQAAASEGLSHGRRVYTVRHGQGKTARTERLTTEVVGITGLPTYDQYGTAEHRRHANRHDFQPNPLNAVVVRQWHGRDYGSGSKTVFLTNASVQHPLQPFDDYDDRSLMENCWIKEAKQQWELGHPP
jgi:Transposase DDE domain